MKSNDIAKLTSDVQRHVIDIHTEAAKRQQKGGDAIERARISDNAKAIVARYHQGEVRAVVRDAVDQLTDLLRRE